MTEKNQMGTVSNAETGSKGRQWMRFVHLYYLLNALMLIGYGAMRLFISSPRLESTRTWTGFTQETEILVLATSTLASKYRKVATMDEFLERVFFLGKVAVAALLFFVRLNYMATYLFVWLGMSLLLQAPRLALPPQVEKLQAGEFQSVVRSADASGKNVAWLVMLHADWCSASTNLQPMFAALARRYADKHRRFAIVDIVACPEVAEELNINTSGISNQIPTLALYVAGREKCRLPAFASDGSVVRARMDERGVTKYFELDRDFKSTSYARRSKRAG